MISEAWQFNLTNLFRINILSKSTVCIKFKWVNISQRDYLIARCKYIRDWWRYCNTQSEHILTGPFNFHDGLLCYFGVLAVSAKRPVILNLIVGPSLSLSDFSLPVSFENAEIGQCPNIAPPPVPLPLPEEEVPEEEKEVSKPLSPPLTPTPAPGPPAVSG